MSHSRYYTKPYAKKRGSHLGLAAFIIARLPVGALAYAVLITAAVTLLLSARKSANSARMLPIPPIPPCLKPPGWTRRRWNPPRATYRADYPFDGGGGLSPARYSTVSSASARRVVALPGFRACGWLSCGAQPRPWMISKLACNKPSPSAKPAL